MLFPKENVLLLNSKKDIKWPIVFCSNNCYTSYIHEEYDIKIWLDIIYKDMNSLWGKKQSQYSPIGAWLKIALVALAHSKFE